MGGAVGGAGAGGAFLPEARRAGAGVRKQVFDVTACGRVVARRGPPGRRLRRAPRHTRRPLSSHFPPYMPRPALNAAQPTWGNFLKTL